MVFIHMKLKHQNYALVKGSNASYENSYIQ